MRLSKAIDMDNPKLGGCMFSGSCIIMKLSTGLASRPPRFDPASAWSPTNLRDLVPDYSFCLLSKCFCLVDC